MDRVPSHDLTCLWWFTNTSKFIKSHTHMATIWLTFTMISFIVYWLLDAILDFNQYEPSKSKFYSRNVHPMSKLVTWYIPYLIVLHLLPAFIFKNGHCTVDSIISPFGNVYSMTILLAFEDFESMASYHYWK